MSSPPFSRRDAVRALGWVTAGAVLAGCGGSGDSSFVPPASNPQPVPPGPLTDASVTVADSVAGSVGAGFAGLSYEKNSLSIPRFTAGNADLIGMFQRLGPGLLRIGGNSVDETQWASTGAGQTSGTVAPPDIDALSAFLRASGWKCLYGVNLATSTPAAAAAEVAYAVQSLGTALSGIEIGNECDLYGGHYFTPWNLTLFEQLWEQFRDAILGAAPGVILTGPASAGSVGSWTVPFGETVGSTDIALLTQHYYRGNGQSASSTIAELLSPDPNIVSLMQTLQAGAATVGVPCRVTETNSFYNGGADGVSDSYASALWVIDHLFHIAQGGGVGANLHGGGDGAGYTPIADSNGVVVGARPEYYGMLLFTLAEPGSLLDASIAAAGLNVSAYPVRSASGGLSIVIVNKDATQSLNLAVNAGQAVQQAQLIELTGPSLDATAGVTIQGAAVAQSGSFAPAPAYTLTVAAQQVSCYVPAASAVLLQLR